MRKIIVDTAVFDKFPKFQRGIIIVDGMDNSRTDSQIEALLKSEAEKRNGGNASADPAVLAWDEAHREFGSNPNKFPPSIKNLLKRIEKGHIPPYINSAVALFNYISLKYLVPCGGDDLRAVQGNLRLGLAKGNEHFTGLGSSEVEMPEVGEVIYYDDATSNIMCRRWNWRNGDFSKILSDSKQIVINIDGIGPATEGLITEARDELVVLLKSKCAATLKTDLLNACRKEIELEI
jgi:lysyl-tRNA synthetase class 2